MGIEALVWPCVAHLGIDPVGAMEELSKDLGISFSLGKIDNLDDFAFGVVDIHVALQIIARVMPVW